MTTYDIRFNRTCHQIGLDCDSLPTAVFYGCPVGLRFEIDADDEPFPDGPAGGLNPVYLEHTLNRAWTLLTSLPSPPDLLRIDWCSDVSGDALPVFSKIGLPQPTEIITRQFFSDGEEMTLTQFYWALPRQQAFLKELLREIIRADLCEDGIIALSSNVYLLSTPQALLYHLYDYRGADIVAADKSVLQPLYRSFRDWILDYDRGQIDALFL